LPLLSGFTRHAMKNEHRKEVDRVIFAADLSEYAFVGISLSVFK